MLLGRSWIRSKKKVHLQLLNQRHIIAFEQYLAKVPSWDLVFFWLHFNFDSVVDDDVHELVKSLIQWY